MCESEKSRREILAKQAELNRKRNAKNKAIAAALLSDKVRSKKELPKIKIIGLIDLPAVKIKVESDKSKIIPKPKSICEPRGMQERKIFKPSFRTRLFEDFNGLCYYCGCRCDLGTVDQPKSASIEHLYCKYDIRGFLVDRNNRQYLVLSCLECNQKVAEAFDRKLEYEPKWEPHITTILRIGTFD